MTYISLTQSEHFCFTYFFLDLTLERSIPTEQWRLKSTEVRERFFKIIWPVACLQTINLLLKCFQAVNAILCLRHHNLSFFFFFPEVNWYLLWYLAYREASKKVSCYYFYHLYDIFLSCVSLSPPSLLVSMGLGFFKVISKMLTSD